MVVFERGEPVPRLYRRFKIKTVEGANDVASIREVLLRRFKRAAEALGEPASAELSELPVPDASQDEPLATEATTEKHPHQLTPQHLEQWATLPDLILIDGGRGQLNAALEALQATGFAHIPTIGVAKGIDRNRFDLVRPEGAEALVLARDSHALHLVQRIDEEAHRFAITYHRKLRSKTALASPLEDIPGIGPRRKRALLKAFGSLDKIRQATVEELAAVPGMTRKAAEELKGML